MSMMTRFSSVLRIPRIRLDQHEKALVPHRDL